MNSFEFITKNEMLFKYFGLAVFFYIILKYAIRIIRNLYVYSFGYIDLKKYGEWAVVTGCTDGIGKTYAEKLAEKGQNVVLISRSLDKLNQMSNYLIEKYKIRTKVVAVDFTEENAIYDLISKELDGLNIGLLFNNVGMFFEYAEYFCEVPNLDKVINDMIHCNIMSVTKITAIVLPGMLKRGKGIIINNSSGSGRTPIPLMSVYLATKAYVDFFSRAISIEYKSKGILIQSLCPMFVATKMVKGGKPSLFMPSATDFVNNAFKTIGYKEITNGCLSHEFQGWLMEEAFPEWLTSWIILTAALPQKEFAMAEKAKKLEILKKQ